MFAHRADWDYSTVVAVHNLAAREASARLELGAEGGLLGLFEDEQHPFERGAATLQLGSYEGRWYRLRRPGQRLPS